MKRKIGIVIGMTLASLAYGKSYKEIGQCGSAAVTEGSTCSNAKVEFRFEGCKSNLGPASAKVVKCEGEKILARYQSGDFRYQAFLKKIDDGWVSITWKLDGPVKEFQAEAPITKIAAPKVEIKAKGEEVTPAPAPATVTEATVIEKKDIAVAAAPVAETSPFKFGGFADVRYTNFHVSDNPLVSSGHPESGFGLEDGAFYLTYDKQKVSIILDVAFRRSKDFDLNTAAEKPNQSSNNNFAIGIDKSQLYIRYKVNPALSFDLGQFDTIFGVELNDSKDRIFGKTGIVYDNTLPVTHTGAMIEYNFLEKFYLKAFAANPNNKGSQGSSASKDDTLELGSALNFSGDNFHTQFGYMSRTINKASGLSSSEKMLLDAIVGGSVGNFAFDFEFSRVSDPSKNSITPDNDTDKEKAGEGYLALFSYKFFQDFLVGSRIEYLRNDPAALGIKSTVSTGLSLHYKLASELELRSEYIAYNNKGFTGNKWKDSRFDFAGVVSF